MIHRIASHTPHTLLFALYKASVSSTPPRTLRKRTIKERERERDRTVYHLNTGRHARTLYIITRRLPPRSHCTTVYINRNVELIFGVAGTARDTPGPWRGECRSQNVVVTASVWRHAATTSWMDCHYLDHLHTHQTLQAFEDLY